jgi:putrescine aminotransferase
LPEKTTGVPNLFLQEYTTNFFRAQILLCSSAQGIMEGMDADALTAEVAAKYAKFVNPTALNLLKMGGFDRVEWQGCGATLTDVHGVDYIDCLGGYGVFSLGHAHPQIVAAVTEQLQRLPLSSKTFLNKPLADLSEKLAGLAPGNLQYTFVCNSGAEACEAAIKFARMATGRGNIVAAQGSYHGKTLGALSASGRDTYKTPFAPLLPGFSHVPFGDIEALRAAVTADTAAVMLEPIQGENGIRIPPDGYLRAAREICDAAGALLILDEVQTGLGRTGRLFASEWEGVAPDLMTLAKALGGGVMPIGAVIGTPAIWEKVFAEHPYIHTSTFGGNEAACAAANAALPLLSDPALLSEVSRKGAKLKSGLETISKKYPACVAEVRGRGLMIGVEFADPDFQVLTIGKLVELGVVVAYTLNNTKVMRIQPPLIITDEQIDTVLAAFDEAVGSVQQMIDELLG